MGLPRPTPLIRLECFPVSRETVDVRIEIDAMPVPYEESAVAGVQRSEPRRLKVDPYDGPTRTMPLIAIAHGRSGDKGSDVNIGIRARHPDFYPVLLRELNVDRVASHLAHLGAESVTRYELAGIQAVNFLLSGALGAGGTASLRFDPQGKALAQQLLDMAVEVPEHLAAHPALRVPNAVGAAYGP
jgi:hypothetical protein